MNPDQTAIVRDEQQPKSMATPGKIAICAIYKDEAPYLREWITYHQMLGVDHFILYDNGSTDCGTEIILGSAFRDMVTIISWPQRPGQLAAYQHCMENHAEGFEWVAFIDVDEFIHPLRDDNLPTLLNRAGEHPAMLLQWMNFGPSGHRTATHGFVIEAYTTRLPINHPVNRHVKSIIRTSGFNGVDGCHVAHLRGDPCDADGKTVKNTDLQQEACSQTAVINHYYTKSWDDWCRKVQRGRATTPDDPLLQRNLDSFKEYATLATVMETRIHRFVPAMRVFCDPSASNEKKAGALVTIGPSDCTYLGAIEFLYDGTIDNISANTLRGWFRYNDGNEAVLLEVFADGSLIGVHPAKDYRADLLDAGIGSGCHAFNIDLRAGAINPSSVISIRPLGRTLAIPNSGKSVEDLRQHGKKIRTMKVRLIMMSQNKAQLALTWIKYHGSIVGYENLILLDNGTTSSRGLSALTQGAKAGATISYQDGAPSDIVGRSETYAQIIQRMDAEDPADFYLRLDCNEFLAVERNGRIDCSSDALEDELSSYFKCPKPLAIYAGLDNDPYRPGFFRWSPNQRKTFFAKDGWNSLDHALHTGGLRVDPDPIRTKVVCIQFNDELLDQSPRYVMKSVEGSAEDFDDTVFYAFPEMQTKFDWFGEELPFSHGVKKL